MANKIIKPIPNDLTNIAQPKLIIIKPKPKIMLYFLPIFCDNQPEGKNAIKLATASTLVASPQLFVFNTFLAYKLPKVSTALNAKYHKNTLKINSHRLVLSVLLSGLLSIIFSSVSLSFSPSSISAFICSTILFSLTFKTKTTSATIINKLTIKNGQIVNSLTKLTPSACFFVKTMVKSAPIIAPM